MRKITNKENKAVGFLKRNLKQCSSSTKEKHAKLLRGLQLNIPHQYGTVIQARTL